MSAIVTIGLFAFTNLFFYHMLKCGLEIIKISLVLGDSIETENANFHVNINAGTYL